MALPSAVKGRLTIARWGGVHAMKRAQSGSFHVTRLATDAGRRDGYEQAVLRQPLWSSSSKRDIGQPEALVLPQPELSLLLPEIGRSARWSADCAMHIARTLRILPVEVAQNFSKITACTRSETNLRRA